MLVHWVNTHSKALLYRRIYLHEIKMRRDIRKVIGKRLATFDKLLCFKWGLTAINNNSSENRTARVSTPPVGTWFIPPQRALKPITSSIDFVFLAFCELRDVHLEWSHCVVPVPCLADRVLKPRRIPLAWRGDIRNTDTNDDHVERYRDDWHDLAPQARAWC